MLVECFVIRHESYFLRRNEMFVGSLIQWLVEQTVLYITCAKQSNSPEKGLFEPYISGV